MTYSEIYNEIVPPFEEMIAQLCERIDRLESQLKSLAETVALETSQRTGTNYMHERRKILAELGLDASEGDEN